VPEPNDQIQRGLTLACKGLGERPSLSVRRQFPRQLRFVDALGLSALTPLRPLGHEEYGVEDPGALRCRILVVIAEGRAYRGCFSKPLRRSARDDTGMSSGVPPDRPVSEPPVDAIPAIVDVRDLVMPLDAYTLGTDDLSTLSRARLALMADCLGRHGFAFEIPEPRPIPWARHERRYGLTDQARAARHGYHVPEITGRPPPREPRLPDDIAEDCLDWARRRLHQDAPDLPEPRLADALDLRAYQLSKEDSRVRAVFSAWSRCMRRNDFSYPDPMAANNDVAFATEAPTEDEIRVAVSDVRCKQQVGVVQVWATVEMAYQRQAVETHRDQLELIRQAIQVRLANAQAVLAGGRPHPSAPT
jgi:hypothetical protein